MKNSERGFVAALVIVIIAVIIIGGGIYLYQKNKITSTISLIPSSVISSKMDPLGSVPFIHPFCLGNDDRFVSADIAECNKKANSYPFINNNGMFDATYPQLDGYNAGEISYQIIGTTTHTMFVSVNENTGGSGDFTSIEKIERLNGV